MYDYSLECDTCFSSCEIIFEGTYPDIIYCPHCGHPHSPELDELDFEE